jgi:transcriptional regulator with XRE-family HTH domain
MEKSTFTHEYRVFCRVLKECRGRASITQAELARKLKETQSEISKFERGERRLDLVQLRRWCRALGISLSEFVALFEAGLPRGR